MTSIFTGYTVAAAAWLVFATAVGLLLAFKFGAPDFWAAKYLTFGRLRPIHTNAMFYGWASIGLVGVAYYVAARSCGTRLYSTRLAWIGLALFNIAAIAGTVALDLGYNDGDLEYREWPWPIRLIFLAALIVTAWNLIGTVLRRSSEDIYLSNWYIIAGVLWTCVAGQFGLAAHFWLALVGSFIYVISLSIGGTVQGLDWVHGHPFIQSVVDMQSYYVWRGVGGMLMFLSHLVFAWNVWRMTSGQPGNAASPVLGPGAAEEVTA